MANRHARQLRADMTDAERRLWWRLRGQQLGGHRFRRQVPLGPYIVDFACLAQRLVIELDGGQHDEQAEQDAVRTAWLEAQGYRVLRFWNPDVLGETDNVVEAIWLALARPHPPPRPSPAGGEGERA
jgi:very-short-patch-repair endonuclease